MKQLGFYQVFDNVGGCAITQLIPASNRLTAALGFLNAYIKKDEKNKMQYEYKALSLIEVGFCTVDDDGMMFMHDSPEEKWSMSGKDIINFIQSEMKVRGVDDFFIDDEPNEGD